MTAYDGSIPQRLEVLARITDNLGQRPKFPHPPPFSLPKYPNFPTNLLPPKFPGTTQRTTKVTIYEEEDNEVPEVETTTIKYPPKPPDDAPTVEDKVATEKTINNSSDVAVTNDVPLTVIPLVAIGGLVVIVAVVILFVWRKNTSTKSKSKKEDMVS